MKTPQEWVNFLRSPEGRGMPALDQIEAIQKDALSDPLAEDYGFEWLRVPRQEWAELMRLAGKDTGGIEVPYEQKPLA